MKTCHVLFYHYISMCTLIQNTTQFCYKLSKAGSVQFKFKILKYIWNVIGDNDCVDLLECASIMSDPIQPWSCLLFLEEIKVKWRAMVYHQQDKSHMVAKYKYVSLSSCVGKCAVWIQWQSDDYLIALTSLIQTLWLFSVVSYTVWCSCKKSWPLLLDLGL